MPGLGHPHLRSSRSLIAQRSAAPVPAASSMPSMMSSPSSNPPRWVGTGRRGTRTRTPFPVPPGAGARDHPDRQRSAYNVAEDLRAGIRLARRSQVRVMTR